MLWSVELTQDEMATIQQTVADLVMLRQREKHEGVAPWEIFDLEDAVGNFEWLLQRVANAVAR